MQKSNHQVTTMLGTSKNVLCPGHNHLLTIGTDTWHFDYHPTASESDNLSGGSSVPFLDVASMVVT